MPCHIDDADAYLPTLEQIAAATAEIRSRWSPKERRARRQGIGSVAWGLPHVSPASDGSEAGEVLESPTWRAGQHRAELEPGSEACRRCGRRVFAPCRACAVEMWATRNGCG